MNNDIVNVPKAPEKSGRSKGVAHVFSSPAVNTGGQMGRCRMWICLNSGFISIVQHHDDAGVMLLRARRREILVGLFPKVTVFEGVGSDYKYRIYVTRTELMDLLPSLIARIDYSNFKASVQDPDLAVLYADFWEKHARYQQ